MLSLLAYLCPPLAAQLERLAENVRRVNEQWEAALPPAAAPALIEADEPAANGRKTRARV